MNIIVKAAAAAPFKLLGALVGGGEDFGEIEFIGGHADLDQKNQLQLKKLAEALSERPNLALIVKGNAAVKDGAETLQSLRILELLSALRKIPQTELIAEAGSQELCTVPENRKALDRMNAELNLKPASDRALQMKEENPELVDEAPTNEVYRQIYMDIKTRQIIDTEDLLALADRRAFSIKQYLVDVLRFDHEKVSVFKTQESDLTGKGIKLELEAL